jgi:hypothetical protein
MLLRNILVQRWRRTKKGRPQAPFLAAGIRPR